MYSGVLFTAQYQCSRVARFCPRCSPPPRSSCPDHTRVSAIVPATAAATVFIHGAGTFVPVQRRRRRGQPVEQHLCHHRPVASAFDAGHSLLAGAELRALRRDLHPEKCRLLQLRRLLLQEPDAARQRRQLWQGKEDFFVATTLLYGMCVDARTFSHCFSQGLANRTPNPRSSLLTRIFMNSIKGTKPMFISTEAPKVKSVCDSQTIR